MMKDVGTVYVLANRDRSLAKLGMTRLGTPQGRALNYTRAHGIVWDLYWSAPTRAVARVEARCHHELRGCRFVNCPGAREVFHITPQRAREVARRHVIAPAGIPWRMLIPRRLIARVVNGAFRLGIGLAIAGAVLALAGVH